MSVQIPDQLQAKQWPRRTRSKVECLLAGRNLFICFLAFGFDETLGIYAKARDGKREFYDAMHGLMMVEKALVRNLKQARRAR